MSKTMCVQWTNGTGVNGKGWSSGWCALRSGDTLDPQAKYDRTACGTFVIERTGAMERRPTCAACIEALAEEDTTLWRVARKPRQNAPYRLRYQGGEQSARAYYEAHYVRQGAAVLLAPGQPLETAETVYTARQSGPNLRTRW